MESIRKEVPEPNKKKINRGEIKSSQIISPLQLNSNTCLVPRIDQRDWENAVEGLGNSNTTDRKKLRDKKMWCS